MLPPSKYKIHLYKEALNFSSAHFVVHQNGRREFLHGHNYKVEILLSTNNLYDDMVFDFNHIKPLVKKICDDLDHKLLIPEKNLQIIIENDSRFPSNYLISTTALTYNFAEQNNCKDDITKEYDYFSLPKKDVLILPILNITVERLSDYLGQRLMADLYEWPITSVEIIEVIVEESPGQSARTLLRLPKKQDNLYEQA